MTPRTRLGDCELTATLGEGDFGIVYLAWDHSLQRKVAVKEYMPAAVASRITGSNAIALKSDRHLETFHAGLKSFVNEARLLARFDHPALVKVYRFWEENGTAYMAMPFYEGPTLHSVLASLGRVPSESELRRWLDPLLDALAVLHGEGVWHQNIAPDNVLMTADGPVLLGMARARHTIHALLLQPAAALAPGFAAIEQYGSEAGSMRGPWTDLYGLGAVLHTAITGAPPVPAADRLTHDRVQPLTVLAAGLYSDGFLQSLDAALAVQPARRPQDHLQMRAVMGDPVIPSGPVPLEPVPDLMDVPFLEDNGLAGAAATDPPPAPPAPPVPPTPMTSAIPATRATPVGRPAASAPAGLATVPMGSDPGVPSWMSDLEAPARRRRRTAWAGLAGLALLGIATVLVMQWPGRAPPSPAAPGSGASRAPASAPAAALSPLPATVAPAAGVGTPATVASPPPSPVPALAPALTPTTAAPPALPAPAPVTATAPAMSTGATASTPVPSAPVPSRPSVASPTSPGSTAAQPPTVRLARCIDILQKASLEPLSAADTDFYKKECQ